MKHKRRQAAMQEIVVLEQEEREIYLGNITHSPTVEELDNRLGSLGIDVGALDSDTNSSSIIEC
ncbi:hypothetical protein JXA59_01010 [Patescibacteria group bacterium]|nr:hypothetical protein [Patescibacteria group bacterium]